MRKTWVRMAGVGLVIAAIAIPAGRFEASRQYTLAYKMDKGATFAVQVKRKHRNHRNFMGNDLTTNTKELTEYRFAVKSSTGDGLLFDIEYAGREHESDDTLALMPPDFSELVGRRVKVLLSPTGVLSDFKGFDDLPEITIPGADQPMGELRYVNDALSLFPRLSGAPVTLGGSWTDVVQYDEAVGDVTLPLTVNYTYTVVEETTFDGYDCLKIEGKYKISMSGPLMVDGLDLELNLAGTGTDIVYFAWQEGMFLRSESHAILKGSADNEDMGVAIPMDHDIETVTTVSLDRRGGH